MSIRSKLALILTGGIATAVGATAVVFLQIQTRQVREAESEKTGVLLESVRQMAGEAALAKDPLMLFDFLEFLRDGRPEVHHARVMLGDRWQDVGGKAMEEPPGGTKRVEVTLDAKGGGPSTAIEIYFLARILDERERAALQVAFERVARAGAGVFLVGLLISIAAARSLTKRIVAIEESVESVAAGEFGKEIPSSGRDEIGRLARGVNAMSAKLKEVEEMKKTFIASVTHELRSPLGAIDAQAKEMLRADSSRPDMDKANLERIRRNAQRLEHFVSNLLEMSKIERGKLDFRPQLGDLGPIVEDTAMFFAPKAKEAGLTLDSQVAGPLPSTRFDPDLIAQVLTNFVSNAIKFTRKGGRVTVSARAVENSRGAEIECAVADSGVGIPEEALKRVFSPFERVRNPLRATGAGLGLAISKSIIDMHKGTVGVSSEIKKGSRFYFRIPVSSS